MSTEICHRISCAWASFTKLKSELCNNQYCRRSRARLFDAVISTTMMYGCSSWTLTEAHEHLTKTRRSMIRQMFYSHRAGTETWVEYIQRATHKSESIMSSFGSSDWIETYQNRKSKFAVSTIVKNDNRWSARLMDWFPLHGNGRHVGRPRTRWRDDLVKWGLLID